jgi:hypothetical protein
MQDPRSPYATALSPSSSNIFSESELTKPIKIKLKPSPTASTPKWKDIARELEADIRTTHFPSN